MAAGLLVMVVWALAYRFLPDTDAPFRIFTPGAVVSVGLWLGISRLFALYLDHVGSYTSIYGALGGAVTVLTWLWRSEHGASESRRSSVRQVDVRIRCHSLPIRRVVDRDAACLGMTVRRCRRPNSSPGRRTDSSAPVLRAEQAHCSATVGHHLLSEQRRLRSGLS